jgi:hypothetical protein
MAEWAFALVGRRDELATLEHALTDIERGRARAVALRGEPGIGKSRPLAELADRARERRLQVLDGRAAELERDLTFALLVDALEQLVTDEALAEVVEDLEEGQLRDLAAVLPAVRRLVGLGAGPVSVERHRVARARGSPRLICFRAVEPGFDAARPLHAGESVDRPGEIHARDFLPGKSQAACLLVAWKQ